MAPGQSPGALLWTKVFHQENQEADGKLYKLRMSTDPVHSHLPTPVIWPGWDSKPCLLTLGSFTPGHLKKRDQEWVEGRVWGLPSDPPPGLLGDLGQVACPLWAPVPRL